MKKINVTFNGTTDTTGYLFSLAKCLSASLRCSEYNKHADDIVATSGFAFRMWVNGDCLCPSAMSIWDFKQQKPWTENGGLVCDYVERLWNEDTVEKERRLAAIEIIKNSIDNGVASVVWDLGDCEWGLVIGYDDEKMCLYTLKINGCEDSLPYENLGKMEIPLLSVLTIIGENENSSDQLVSDTKKLALSHLRGEEWCENAKGLAAYDALINFIANKLSADTTWELEYYLGTYAALKWYAWKFFEKYNEPELAAIYKSVHEAWQNSFSCKCSGDVTDEKIRSEIVTLLTSAKTAEIKALEIMSE